MRFSGGWEGQVEMARIKAIGLFSGGLDSVLAFKVLQEQGVETIGVHFFTPFYSRPEIKDLAKKFKIDLIVVPVLDEYIEGVLKSPVCGYGKNFNPCIDCHAFMVRKAGELMPELGAEFVFTGEVLGERPFSQNSYGLRKVEELSGIQGYLLRPLSAKLLPETVPERKGWVDRARLLDIKGRGRQRQIELSKRYGIAIDPSLQPAGGCLLTDPFISKRIRAYVRRFHRQDLVIYPLIKTGRHFLVAEDTGLIIGRNRFENEVIKRYKSKGVLLESVGVPGPLGLIFGKAAQDPAVHGLCARILASYCKGQYGDDLFVNFSDGDGLGIKKEDRKRFSRYAI